MAARGRTPSTRGVFALDAADAPAPHAVVLDTSFVVDALLPAQPRHVACAGFLQRLVRDGVLVFFNKLLELELIETAYQIALRERHGHHWRRARHDRRALRRATRIADALGDAWGDVLAELPWGTASVEDVVDDVPDFMRRYGLGSYDAVHAATAARLGVGAIATLDASFAAVPEHELVLYVDAALVARCRRQRAR